MKISLFLGHNSMNRIIALWAILIYIPNIVTRLEICFDFNVNGFCYYLVITIEFLALIFYLNLNQKALNFFNKTK